MAIVKSKCRNRVHSTTLTMMMTVDLHSSEILMQPYTIGIGSRRLEVLKHKGRRKPSMLIFSYTIEIESLIYLNIGLKIDLI